MPFQSAPNVAKVAITSTLKGESCINTLHFVGNGSTEGTALAGLATGVRTIWETYALPSLPPDYQLLGIDVSDQETEGGIGEYLPPSGTGLGTLNQAIMPNNVTIAVSFKTARRGRSYRGRNFWPCLFQSQVSDNRLAAASAAAIVSIYNRFKGQDTVAAGWLWVVLSRRNGGQARPLALSEPITAVQVTDLVLDSQRRRLPKRGQ